MLSCSAWPRRATSDLALSICTAEALDRVSHPLESLASQLSGYVHCESGGGVVSGRRRRRGREVGLDTESSKRRYGKKEAMIPIQAEGVHGSTQRSSQSAVPCRAVQSSVGGS